MDIFILDCFPVNYKLLVIIMFIFLLFFKERINQEADRLQIIEQLNLKSLEHVLNKKRFFGTKQSLELVLA